MPKGLNITYKPLDEDHVWAIMTWAEQDVGGGHLTVEVAVRNRKPHRNLRSSWSPTPRLSRSASCGHSPTSWSTKARKTFVWAGNGPRRAS